jgi:hypothetical protein
MSYPVLRKRDYTYAWYERLWYRLVGYPTIDWAPKRKRPPVAPMPPRRRP